MADNVTVDNGAGTDYTVSTDEGTGGHVARVKLAYSADGSETHVSADADGLLVNLGANNDVTITSGTVAIGSTVTPGTGATNLGKAEDAAHTTGDVGVAALAVRRDSAAVGSGTDGDYSTLNVDASGRLWANVGNTVTVDGSGVTQPVSNAGLTSLNGAISGTEVQVDVVGALPAGDNNIGNVDVLSLPASTNTIEVVGDAAHDAAAAGNPVLIGAEFDDTTPDSVDEGDVGRLRISANRNLYSTIRDAAGNERGANVNASNQLSVSVDNTVTVASHAVTNAGTFATQVDGAALTALQLIDDPVFTDDAAFTPGTSKVMMVGAEADEASIDSVNEGDAGALRMTLDRKLYVHVAPNDLDGLSIFRTLDADETEEDVKTSAGKLYGWYIYNDGAAEVYVKFYNATAANVTVGTTTPTLTVPIPAGSAANVEYTNGIAFSTAITIAATTGVADNDTTAPAANQVVANIFYK